MTVADPQLLEKLQKSKYCGEVPATKLAALQKVLQSEFLNAVREVSPDGGGWWQWRWWGLYRAGYALF